MTTAVLHSAPRALNTDLFGALNIREENVLRFNEGLFGFPTCNQWVLIEGARAGTAWLQSADLPALAFLLVDPFLAFDGFSVDIDDADVCRLGAARDADLLVYALVTIQRDGTESVTANLNGPLVIDVRARRGMQVILPDNGWSVREPVPVHVLGRAARVAVVES